MNDEQQNMAILRRIYDAYNRKDINPLMASLADDVKLVEQASRTLPWGGEWIGAEGMARFLECVVEELDHQEYICEDIIARGNTVVAWGYFDTKCRKSSHTCKKPWMHRIIMKQGKIAEIHEFYDSLGVAEDLNRL